MSDQDRDDLAPSLTRETSGTHAAATAEVDGTIDRRRPDRSDVAQSLIPLLRGELVAGSPSSDGIDLEAPAEKGLATKNGAGRDGLDAVRGITFSLVLGAVFWLLMAGIYWLA